jgi:uncharacterized protein DUF6875
MLINPTNPDCYLLSVDDLDDDALPRRAQPYADPLRAVADWARDYLSAPHPELGRGGPVCPYVPTALKRRLFYLTVQPGGGPGMNTDAVRDAVATYRDWFMTLPPRGVMEAQFKTILILFPGVVPAEAPRIIDGTQAALKLSFVEQGLMLGQFHPVPPSDGGLWNADFRPLRCPVPLLAIRHMVPTDLPFLTGDRRLLDGYREVFGDALPDRQRCELARALAAHGATPARVG